VPTSPNAPGLPAPKRIRAEPGVHLMNPLETGEAFHFGNSCYAYVLKNVLGFKDYLPSSPGMCY
jgi:hypothetical protein